MEVTKMARLLETRPEYFARQDEANAKMNRKLWEEQRIGSFMKGPAQGTNPIPSLIGGKNYGSGIIGIQRDPNELGLGGGIPDTTPLFTNRYGREQEGLLASMGIRPEVLAQAKTQQQPFSGTREQAYQMAMKKASEMGINLEVAAKQFNTAFPETKAYTPQTQILTKDGKIDWFDMNNKSDFKRARQGGWKPYKETSESDTAFQRDIGFLQKSFPNMSIKDAIRMRKSVEGQSKEAAMLKAYQDIAGNHERKLKAAQDVGKVWNLFYGEGSAASVPSGGIKVDPSQIKEGW